MVLLKRARLDGFLASSAKLAVAIALCGFSASESDASRLLGFSRTTSGFYQLHEIDPVTGSASALGPPANLGGLSSGLFVGSPSEIYQVIDREIQAISTSDGSLIRSVPHPLGVYTSLHLDPFAPIPEPSTALLLEIGLAGMSLRRRATNQLC